MACNGLLFHSIFWTLGLFHIGSPPFVVHGRLRGLLTLSPHNRCESPPSPPITTHHNSHQSRRSPWFRITSGMQNSHLSKSWQSEHSQAQSGPARPDGRDVRFAKSCFSTSVTLIGNLLAGGGRLGFAYLEVAPRRGKGRRLRGRGWLE